MKHTDGAGQSTSDRDRKRHKVPERVRDRQRMVDSVPETDSFRETERQKDTE